VDRLEIWGWRLLTLPLVDGRTTPPTLVRPVVSLCIPSSLKSARSLPRTHAQSYRSLRNQGGMIIQINHTSDRQRPNHAHLPCVSPAVNPYLDVCRLLRETQAISLPYFGGRPLSLTFMCEHCLYLCRVWKLADRYVLGLRVKEDIRTNEHGGMGTAAKLRLTLVQGTCQQQQGRHKVSGCRGDSSAVGTLLL
jgi:hypothetical protein